MNRVKQDINGLNILEMAKSLNVCKASIQNWIKRGLFNYKVINGKKVIRYNDLKTFKEKYIPAAFISSFKATNNADKLVQRLINEGVIPVSGKRVDGGIGYLYLRNDIEKFYGFSINW